MRLGKARHKHTPKFHRKIDDMNSIEVCLGCGRRRTARLGYGSESGVYFSRWFDNSEFENFKLCFPEAFKETTT